MHQFNSSIKRHFKRKKQFWSKSSLHWKFEKLKKKSRAASLIVQTDIMKNNSWNESKKYIAVLQGKYSKKKVICFINLSKKDLMKNNSSCNKKFSKDPTKRQQEKILKTNKFYWKSKNKWRRGRLGQGNVWSRVDQLWSNEEGFGEQFRGELQVQEPDGETRHPNNAENWG